MLKSSGAIAAATMTSRVLGMVREMVYASFMGNGWVASAFFLAFQVPNLFRRLLGEGALTAAFIPIFKHKEINEGEVEMWRAGNAVISFVLSAAGAITVGAIVILSLVLLNPNLKPQTALMLQLLRWMFPYMLLVCLAAVYIGMANARGHFFIPALGAVMLNAIMISSVVFLAPHMGVKLERRVFALAIGVVVAGFAQAFFQVPSLRREGYRFQWISPRHDPTVRQVVAKMLPGSIGVAAFQINVLITQCFSYWFDPTIVSNFNYAVRLMELPQGIFGISLATYLLPTLSGLAAEKKYSEFRESLSDGLSYLSFANLLAAAIAFALAEPIVRLLFERGAFDASGTARVGLALSCLAPGLLMFSMNNILARAFYALNDIKTPMKISVLCLILNIGFALILIRNGRREAGLATANTISACINLSLLVYALRRKLSRLGLSKLRKTLIILLPNAILAAVIAKLCGAFWEHHFGHPHLAAKIGAVFVPGAVACLAYWLIALAANEPAAHDILKVLRRRSTLGS